MTDFPGGARRVGTGFSINGEGYIGTGWNGSGRFNDNYEYDTLANSWIPRANVGGPGRNVSLAFTIGSKGYVGTGWDGSIPRKDIWEFDPVANTWTQIADFGGVARHCATAFTVGNKGYVGIGHYNQTYYPDFWEYDPNSNVWVQKADFGGGVRHLATGFALNGNGYIGVGEDQNTIFKDFWEYDPLANTWTQKSDFGGSPRFSAVGFAFGCYGYIGTGDLGSGSGTKDFWAYNPSTDTWMQMPDLGGSQRVGAVGFSIGNKGYVGTGSATSSTYLDDFWEFSIEGPSVLSISWTDLSCGGASDGTITIGASGGLGPLVYSVDNGASFNNTSGFFSGLGAGNYDIVVQDSTGCEPYCVTVDLAITISEPPPISISSAFTSITCNGISDGSINILAVGGTGPLLVSIDSGLTYQSSGGFFNLDTGTYYVTAVDSLGCVVYGDSISITAPPQMSSAITSASPTCGGNDGELTVVVSGGTPSYMYTWDDSLIQTSSTATGLDAGIYTVYITDSNSCLDSVSYVLNSASAPTIVVDSTTFESCSPGNDANIYVSLSGGTAPFTYLWSNLDSTEDIAGISVGTYSITVTDSVGCISIEVISIFDDNNLTLTLAGSDILCFGEATGSVNASALNGAQPLTYLWDDPVAQTDSIATGLSSGLYGVTVTDANGCMLIDDATLTEPSALNTVITYVNVTCSGNSDGEAAVLATGGSPGYAYLWDDPNAQTNFTATGLIAGFYQVTVSDLNGCTEVEIVLITENAALVLIISDTGMVKCAGDTNGNATVVVVGGITPYTYSWDDPANQTTAVLSGVGVGDYSVLVTDADSCTSTISISVISSGSQVLLADFFAEPNPVSLYDSEVTFTDESVGDIIEWYWTFLNLDNSTIGTDTLENSSFQFPFIPGSYPVNLLVVDDYGCTHDTTLYIDVLPDYILFAPNTFTPNGDGMNDEFFPQGLGLEDAKFEMYIYNRWGDMIFKSVDVLSRWDGTANGGSRIAQEDIYIWLILTVDYLNREHKYVGHVSIVR